MNEQPRRDRVRSTLLRSSSGRLDGDVHVDQSARSIGQSEWRLEGESQDQSSRSRFRDGLYRGSRCPAPSATIAWFAGRRQPNGRFSEGVPDVCKHFGKEVLWTNRDWNAVLKAIE